MERQTDAPIITHTARKPWGKWAATAVIVILVAATAGLIWQLSRARDQRDSLEREKQELQKKIDDLSKKDGAAAEADDDKASGDKCSPTVSEALKTAIRDALSAKNYTSLSPHLATSVNVVFAASEKGGNVSSAQAITDMAYLSSATGPWDFALPAATINNYRAGFYTAYFPGNAYVGKSADSMVVAFGFDSCAKINMIFVSANEDLLL